MKADLKRLGASGAFLYLVDVLTPTLALFFLAAAVIMLHGLRTVADSDSAVNGG